MKKSSFVKQAAILAVAGLFVRMIGFLYRLPMTGMIGDEGNGIYGASFYIYMFFLIVSSAGLPVAISKMVSSRLALRRFIDADRVFRVSLVFAGSVGLIFAVLLGVFAKFLANAVSSPQSALSILMLSPTVFIVALMSVYRGYFQGFGNTAPTAFSQIVEQVFNAVFSLLLCFLFMRGTGDIAKGAAGGTAGTGVGALFGFLALLFTYKLILPTLKREQLDYFDESILERRSSIIKELLKTSVPIIIGTAIFSLTNFIDMKMVNSLLLKSGYVQNEVDALYGMLTVKYVALTTLPVVISSSIASAVIPNISAHFASGEAGLLNKKINTALRYTMIVSVPAAVGMGVLATPIIKLLFPGNPDGAYLLKIGAISIIFLALSQIMTGVLQGIGYTYIPAIAALFGGLAKIPLNFALIPIKSVTIFGKALPLNVGGAVISTIVCYALASVINTGALRRILGDSCRIDFVNGLLKPLAAAALMGVCCYLFYSVIMLTTGSNAVSCILAILLGSAVYLAFMMFIKGIVKSDLPNFLKKYV